MSSRKRDNSRNNAELIMQDQDIELEPVRLKAPDISWNSQDHQNDFFVTPYAKYLNT